MLNLSTSGDAQGQHLNASFTQGDVVNIAFIGKINDAAMNLTSSSIRMTIAFLAPLLLSTDNGAITITNPATGQFTVNMNSTTTAAFTPGTYNYDLWIEYQTSPPIENQYITGTISVVQSVTEVP